MQGHKIVSIHSPSPALAVSFHKELGVSKALAQLLINRGIDTLPAAQRFLSPVASNAYDPFLFSQMSRAVSLTREVIARGGKVLVAGDYDVDGITSTAVLTHALKRLGAAPEHYLPHRVKDGYGLNRHVVAKAKDKGVSLVITADCGTNNPREIAQLKAAGVQTIVTDHHELSSGDLPDAESIINPKLDGSGYPFRELAGVGVAFKFSQALCASPLEEDLDLVALGTIADVVPLLDENRIFVSSGLAALNRTTRAGLKALLQSSRVGEKKLNAGMVSFILGPRINASGRMDTAEVALQLLMSTHPQEAEDLARTIEQFNRQRQKIESGIMEEALALVEKEFNFKEDKVIVVAKEEWHHGVLGVVASKIADRFYRPAIIISMADGSCKGSGRSIRNFHLFQALRGCSDTLLAFGGHSHAVGLSVDKGKIHEFRDRINLLANETLKAEDLIPCIEVDMEIPLRDATVGLAKEMERMEPFGCANPKPLFYTQGLSLKGVPQTMARETLKFWVTDGEHTVQVIGFGMAALKESLRAATSISLVYTPKVDSWMGANSMILEAEEIMLR